MPSLVYESLSSHSVSISSVKLLTTRSKLLLTTHLRNHTKIPTSDFPSQLRPPAPLLLACCCSPPPARLLRKPISGYKLKEITSSGIYVAQVLAAVLPKDQPIRNNRIAS
ncbi:hypothetical protein L1987_37881 [Smallanthus sonchifolius]|uniref:Uncharacterized protein n=1 Tax=Smallanthus sonchifolius TaxID=185202 RepID=A0ACB9HHJ8_9ASTR|nr:hypothetical protein L1987_37881 [Smallanthus sonchifolius]